MEKISGKVKNSSYLFSLPPFRFSQSPTGKTFHREWRGGDLSKGNGIMHKTPEVSPPLSL